MKNNNTFKGNWSGMDTQAVSYLTVTSVFLLTSNLMLIYGFCKTNRTFKTVTKLFIYLSTVDIAFMMVMSALYIVLKVAKLDRKFFDALTNASMFSIFIMDTFIFWTISFLRFLSIYKPIYQVKTRMVHIALLIELFISFLAAIAIFWIYNSVPAARLKSIDFIFSITILFAAIIINLLLNILSLIILKRSTNSKTHQKRDDVLRNQGAIKRKKRALNTLLIITVVQLGCTISLPLMAILSGLLGSNIKFNVFVFCQCLLASSFGFNSIIVILRTKYLREFYTKKCCFIRENESLDNRNTMELSTI